MAGSVRTKFGEYESWGEDTPMHEPKTAIEVGEDAEPAGMLDQHGNQIVRMKQRIGFRS